VTDDGRASLTDTLSGLNRIRFSSEPMSQVLEQVTQVAKRALVPEGETSITLVRGGKGWTAAFTGQLALDLDERQYEVGFGPCVDSAVSGTLLHIKDMATEDRWPAYTPGAVKLGAGSSLSVPLPLLQDLSGALNVYSLEPHHFSDADLELAETVASYAATPLVNAIEFTQAVDLAAQLREAMKSRATIEQAKGILMERHKLPAETAFDLLVKASQAQNRKLRDLADDLVSTGSIERKSGA
jgi:GAF domain-containing protein